MTTDNVIEVRFGNSTLVSISPKYRYDSGWIMKFVDLDLPESYQVHFGNTLDGDTIEVIGDSNGVEIPDILWTNGEIIYCWLYLHPTEHSSITKKEVRIAVGNRGKLPAGVTPEPQEQTVIDQLIGALNSAVEQTAQDVIDADASAQSASESAEQAQESARTAGLYSDTAQTYANSAEISANSASASATASAQSASQSAINSADAQDSAEEAQGYASASAQSASASANSASQASASATSASQSASSASGYATSAQSSAQTASTKASEASTSASTASAKATESAQSASQALSYKTDAESAKTASQTAQGLAESARDSAVSAKTDAESAKADAESARDEAQQAVASISGALAEKAPVITDTASGSIASFSDGADGLPLKSLVVDINPVQDLHGQDSPYPAGGGKNLLPCILESGNQNGFTWTVGSDGVIVISGSSSSGVVEKVIGSLTLESGTYRMNGGIYPTNDIRMQLKLASGGSSITMSYNNNDVAFTIKETASYTVSMVIAPTTISGTTTIKPMIRLSSVTDATYAPYSNICPISGWTQINVNHSDADTTNPTTITIDLGQTVYGGKLDVLSGELTVYPYYASYNGETLTGEWISDRDKYVSGTTPTIGAQVVNIGAEGTEIQLEPHEVESLYGVNNLWADSGDTEVEYRADTKLFIERLTAPDSTDMIADANITSGQYFMVGNSLYKATANIANGSAIIVGTNCIRKSLSEALNEINA